MGFQLGVETIAIGFLHYRDRSPNALTADGQGRTLVAGFNQNVRARPGLAAKAATKGCYGRRDGRMQCPHDNVSIKLSNILRPSVPPNSGSTTRSGCGIRPSTLRFS